MMTNLIVAAMVATNALTAMDGLTNCAGALYFTDGLFCATSAVSGPGIVVYLESGGTLSDIRETVERVTNTTPEIVREITGWESVPSDNVIPGGLVLHRRPVYGPENEKTETTTITEVTTLQFKWNGVECKQLRERVVGEPVVRRWKKSEDWKEVEP